MKTIPTIPTLAALALSVVLGTGLAGCSSDGSDGAGKATTTTVASEAPAAVKEADDGIISPKLPKAPKLSDPTGIRSDASLDGCDTEAGDVTAHGKVRNASDETVDIVVTVSWVVSATSDVVARSYVKIPGVVADEQVRWNGAATLGKGYDDVQCVLNVRRGTLAS